MDLSKFENQCAVLVCCLLAAALIQGCGMSHRATPDAGTPPVMGDAGAIPVTDSAPPAADAGPSFYEWPDTGPVPTPVDAGTDAPVCLSEDEPYDGIDNDCNGWVDDDQRLHGDNAWACDSATGCFWFCEPWEAHGSDMFGFRGCCTSGRFPTSDHVEHGMIVKGSGPAVYYIADDGRRYVFASTNYLASWFLQDDGMRNLRRDAWACRDQVVQISDELLASIPLGGNAPMRPGVIATGIVTDPARWVVDHGHALRRIDDPALDLNLAAPWLVSHEIMTPDFLFVSFVIGTDVSDTSWRGIYDGQRIYDEATLDGEIHALYGSMH